MTRQKVIKKNIAFALKNPRVTEKASVLSSGNVYTFDVPKDFNKSEISKAVETIYKVRPVKIRMIAVPAKSIIYRNRPGVKSGGKKAIIYLKKGDKIEFV